MIPLVEGVVRLAMWLLIAPLLPGVINRVKAWVAGRRGPPVFQLYYDLAKLWRKGVVLSTTASPAFVVAPAVAWVGVVVAAMLMPLCGLGLGVGFKGDALLFLYLLAMARFCTAWAAMETGSAFEGMGVVRELSYAILSEASLMTAVLALGIQTGTLSMAGMLVPSTGAGAVLLAVGLFTVLLAENSRVPFDDPDTHLELTMVHEVMILDHSGLILAAALHGASVKLMLFAVFLIQATIPLEALGQGLGLVVLIGGVFGVAVSVGVIESFMARLAFRRVPLLLVTALLLCVFALLVAWKGGAA